MGRIVYCQGSFDILHRGHINLLRRCRKLVGDDGVVCVALITDDCYKEYRGYQPAQEYADRCAVLESLEYVDIVVPADNKKTKQQIDNIQPDYVVLGTDWAKKDIYKQYDMTREELDDYLVFFPYTEGISSTHVKERIKKA